MMKIQITTATKKLLRLKRKIRAISGGTGASKTFSIMMILIDYAQTCDNSRIDVVSESFPHLEDGAISDFKSIMIGRNYWNDSQWNDTKHTYFFENGSELKFISFDKLGKAHGPRRDVLFLNECNYLPFAVIDQLITRTRKIVWLDWNPTNEFWFYSEMLGHRQDIDFMGEGGEYPPLTYLDNEALSETEISEIESRKNKVQWWRVYGQGLMGQLEDRIFIGWQMIDAIPHEAKKVRTGLNFGYTNHPAAIADIYFHNGGYIIDEVAYGRGIKNRQLADIMLNGEQALTVADSAEPKSIDEIREYGVLIIPAQKGKDSVRNGINRIQQEKISITKRSVNIIKEYRNYLWKKDRNGITLNVPEEPFHYSMDAVRYGLVDVLNSGNDTSPLPPPMSNSDIDPYDSNS